MFDFQQSYIIKTLEKSISVDETTKSISMLSNKFIEAVKQKYKYIHLGLIQIAIKTLP